MKKQINLTGKIYTIEFLIGIIFYSVGIMLLPTESTGSMRYLIGSLIIGVQFIIIAKNMLTPSEEIDERAKNNFHRASHWLLMLILCSLIVLGILLLVFQIHILVTLSLIFFTLAALLTLHALLFLIIEKLVF